MAPITLGYAFIGGLLPPLIWLYFLLKEDASHPEPRVLIALTFIGGMAAVPLALPLEQYAKAHLLGDVASAAIGFALAFSTADRPAGRAFAAALGLILAIVLHTAFNMLIINEGASTALAAFFFVWIAAVIFFAVFEVLKYFQYRSPNNNPPLP